MYMLLQDTMREKLVMCIKTGSTLVISMQQSVCDFATKFNDAPTDEGVKDQKPDTEKGTKSFFPAEAFVGAGRALISEEWIEKLWRDADTEDSSGFKVRKVTNNAEDDKFRVVVTTWFAPTPDEDNPDIREFEVCHSPSGAFSDRYLLPYIMLPSLPRIYRDACMLIHNVWCGLVHLHFLVTGFPVWQRLRAASRAKRKRGGDFPVHYYQTRRGN